MAGTKTRNTMGEVLQGILQDISQAKTLPDADLEFLLNMETAILSKLRQPMEQMMGQLEGAGSPPGAPPLAPGGGCATSRYSWWNAWRNARRHVGDATGNARCATAESSGDNERA